MKKIVFQNEKGFTGIDITVAIIIILLFVSLITGLLYNVYLSTVSNEITTTANSYLMQIFEEIDMISYDQIIEDTKVGSADIFIQKLQLELKGDNIEIKRGMRHNYTGRRIFN